MKEEKKSTVSLSKTIAKVLSQDFAKVILLNEVAVAAEISTKLESFNKVERMVLYTKSASPIYQYSKDKKSFSIKDLPPHSKRTSTYNGNNLTLYNELNYLNTHIGYVQITLHVQSLKEIVMSNIMLITILYLFMVLLSYFLALYYSKRFTQPILSLVTFLEHVEVKNPSYTEIKTCENNEYGKLYQEINIMLKRIYLAFQENRISSVAFETQSGMTITDINHKIIRVNKAFSRITGYSEKEAIGNTPAILKSGIQGEKFYRDMETTLRKYNYWSGEIFNRHKDGSIFPEYLTIQTVVNEMGNPLYYVASFIDLTLQKETEAKLQYLKQYDTLTGLLNKELFIQKLDTSIQNNSSSQYGALICFDIKEFKLLNDAYGHSNADKLLLDISSRLKNSCSTISLFGRIGADEFIIWFDSIGKNKELASINTKELILRLINILSKSFNITDNEVYIESHLGISLCNSENINASSLYKQADSALHIAKRANKEYAFYDEDAQNIAIAHIDMYTQLRYAVKNNNFELLYQLQYIDNIPYGAEALIRWNHAERGVVSPLEFIPVAESSGLILPIGKWIIEEACRELARWSKNPKSDTLTISINISAKQFAQDDLVSQIKAALTQNRVNPSLLKVELTESIIADDLDEIIEKMKQLQSLGIKTSLDDFGTGYSSLEYLKKLPLNQVKIDQTFVKNMIDDSTDIAIIKSIILISEARGLEVIAEGVETKEHYELLKELGCNHFQGYYFARPQKVKDLEF